ncbi:MAG: maltose ABC transporter substrate-binding protein, partial [Eubacteriales bacterium]|nr:maltose ABC transporter substrate-binding protein [Eubacteriales bacterium]
MNKKLFPLLTAVLLLLLPACGGQPSAEAEGPTAREEVSLTVWGAEEDEALLQEIFASFQSQYSGEANLHITYPVSYNPL